MNAAMQLTHATIAAPQEYGASGVSHDTGHDQELYAIWKSVFERARPVEIPHESAHAAIAHASARQGSFHAGGDDPFAPRPDATGARLDDSRPASWTDVSLRQERIAAASSARMPAFAVAETGSTASAVVSLSTSVSDSSVPVLSTGATSRDRSELQSAQTVGHGGASDNAGAVPSNTRLSMQSASAQTAPADSVSVFVRSGAVAIVVRDAGISEQQALHCAFETTHRLVGQRGSLQQLIFNGRTLYQQPLPASTLEPLPLSALAFAC